MQVQEVFIKRLKESVAPSVSLAEELADLLKVSTDSAYRRLRNETEFTLKEVYTLSKHFNISVDSLFSFKDDYVTCNYIKLTDSEDNFEKYLSSIARHTKSLLSIENSRIIYAAEEIPIFHSMGPDAVRAFKLFYWQRSVLNVPEYQNKKFTMDIIPKKIMNIGAEIYDMYTKIPSIEIWTEKTILTTVKQIEFYFESGAFKAKEDALHILQEMHKMADTMNAWAEHESKTGKPGKKQSFWLYNSELIIGTNAIHIETEQFNSSFISFNTMNSLTTSNQSFCEEIEHWMKNLMKKSTLISGSAEKQRFRFFNQVHKHITAVEEKIKNY
ncbi:MAG: helix-turn-helix domain-containing protein [Bacteroidia bacterium]